jgi:hypothetical protein
MIPIGLSYLPLFILNFLINCVQKKNLEAKSSTTSLGNSDEEELGKEKEDDDGLNDISFYEKNYLFDENEDLNQHKIFNAFLHPSSLNTFFKRTFSSSVETEKSDEKTDYFHNIIILPSGNCFFFSFIFFFFFFLILKL